MSFYPFFETTFIITWFQLHLKRCKYLPSVYNVNKVCLNCTYWNPNVYLDPFLDFVK